MLEKEFKTMLANIKDDILSTQYKSAMRIQNLSTCILGLGRFLVTM